MKRWIKKFGRLFVSVVSAEMSEYYDAMNMLGIRHVDPKKLWNDVFISVTFAEAG